MKTSRGITLAEVLIGGAIAALGIILAIAWLDDANNTKKMVEAKSDVDGITRAMRSAIANMPGDVEGYKGLLASKWSKVYDPWGNHYRMVVYTGTVANPCELGTTNLSIELSDGRVIRDVLYFVWTRPEKMPDTGEAPQAQEAEISDFKTAYARYAGKVKLTRGTIFDIYTLDMHKAQNCEGVYYSTP